jgi:periplasmic divalent cation tolerance protein
MAQHSEADHPNYGVVLVTASSQTEAEAIAQALLQAQLAACVNFLPIRSVYTWNGEVHNEAEYQLLIKTDLRLFAQLENKVREVHSYEVPEIVAVPIVAGASSYLSWISQQVTPQPQSDAPPSTPSNSPQPYLRQDE